MSTLQVHYLSDKEGNGYYSQDDIVFESMRNVSIYRIHVHVYSCGTIELNRRETSISSSHFDKQTTTTLYIFIG